MFRIMLVQQLSLFRTALATVLSAEDDLEVVAEINRVDQAVPVAQAVVPDAAVIDFDLLTNSQVAVVRRLNDAVPGCAVVVLAGPTLTQAGYEALERYACGLVSKDNTPGQLAAYLRRAARGERVLDPVLAVSALSGPRNPLTARERDILLAAGTGASSAELAAQLHLSTGTIRNYLSAIMRKTGARNRLEAIRIAKEAGWL